MTEAPDQPHRDPAPTGTTQTQDGPRVTREEIRDLGRLRRTTGTQRNIGGVAGGLGRHLDIDPVILRVAFVVLAFFGGAGLLLYAACWLLVPDDTSTRSPLGLDDRSRSVGLVIAGGIAGLALVGTAIGSDGFIPFPLVVVAGIALLVVTRVNKHKGGAAAVAPQPSAAPVMDAPGAAAAPFTMPPPPPVWTGPPVRVDERKKGPILFWFTLALSALGVGALGILDLAGARVAGPAYPGLVLGITGAMLLLGAFWGRAGGLILIGLLSTTGLLAAVAAQEIDGEQLNATPATAAALRPSYDIDTGELVLDLRDVTDLEALDGRTIDLSGGVGRIEVIVPEGLDVTARGSVGGPGNVEIFDDQRGGINTTLFSGTPDTPAPDITIDAVLGVGEIQIRTPRPFERTTP